MWRGHIKGEHIVATVHGDDITIGGERSAVEILIRMISKKYEIKKQVTGEDPDFEKSGRILNRVIEWNRDGITKEADQRHVRELLKGLDLERAKRSTTPCAVDRRDEGKGERRHGQGQTQTEHEWSNASNSDDKDRPQMADDDDPDSQALANGDITRCSTRGADQAACRKIEQISSLRQCRYAVQWQSHRCATWNASRGSDDTSLESRGRGAGSAGSTVVNWRHTQMLTGEATKATR